MIKTMTMTIILIKTMIIKRMMRGMINDNNNITDNDDGDDDDNDNDNDDNDNGNW